jgi:amino acid adenylation domain-containing protein
MNTLLPHISETNLYSAFEQQATKTPHALAIKMGNEAATYQQLKDKVNLLTHHLIQQDIKMNTPVAISLPRCFDMIASVLAVLKTGGTYLPLGDQLPLERSLFLIKDAKAPLLITDKESSLWHNFNGQILEPAKIEKKEILLENAPSQTIKDKSLAYIIYTSGSTGKPKGVMIDHASILSLMEDLQKLYPLQQEETMLFHSPFNFDASVEEIFWPLLFGGTVVIAPSNIHQNIENFIDLISSEKIANIRFVPSFLETLLEVPSFKKCHHLKRVFSGGEPLKAETMFKFMDLLPMTELHNDYGPTEATVRATTYKCNRAEIKKSVPIGKPLPGKEIYILNEQMTEVTPGQKGEIYIGGKGLAQGYLNLPDLTKEKFVFLSLDSNPKKKLLYRTGDFGRFLPDGNIEFLGRQDEQIKIRGNRIELGEIEATLQSHSSINQSVVKPFSYKGDNILVAYIRLKKSNDFNKTQLNQYLSKFLPEYMIPNSYIETENFPLNSNGKIDRKNLPEPNFDAFQNPDYCPPETQAEKMLAVLWEELLGVKCIGKQDNFFEKGGHSLLVVQLIIKLKSKGIIVDPGDIFSHPTLSEMSQLIQQNSSSRSNHEAA